MLSELTNEFSKCGTDTCSYAGPILVGLNGETAQAGSPGCVEDDISTKHSINLELLSMELKRQTKETQKLQDEVEQATRHTLERMGCIFNNEESSENQIPAKPPASEGSSEYGIYSQQSFMHSIKNNVDVPIARCLSLPGRYVLEQTIKDYSHQISSDLQPQLREKYELQDQQKFHFRQSDIKFETKLQEKRIEKDTLADLRMTESQQHCERLPELHLLKLRERQKQAEAADRVLTFNCKSEMMEQTLQGVFTKLLDYEKRSGKNSYLCSDGTSIPGCLALGTAVEKALQDLERENHSLKERLQLENEKFKDLEKQKKGRTDSLLKEQRERMEQLITSHDQQAAVLTEKLMSSRSKSDRLQLQVEALQKQIENQALLYQSEMSHLESTVSKLHSDLLEKQQTYEAKMELCQPADQSLTIQNLRQELEHCSQDVQQLRSLVQSLEEQCRRHMNMQDQSDRKAKQLQALLQQRDTELQLKQQEVQQTRALLENAQAQVQALLAEAEVMKLKLKDWESSAGMLRRPLVALQQERSNLSKQLEQLQLDNQQLRTALQQAEVRLSSLEHEKHQQQIILSERTCSLHQLTMEKQQMITKLEMQHQKLVQIKEEQEVLQEQHSRKAEELEEQNGKLEAQLNYTQDELEHARSNLRALGGADGHGLRIALGMQKQITAKREQVDLLQSRVQMLEETTEKLLQEKRYQAMQSKRQAQELLIERKQRRKLESELAAKSNNEKVLRSEVGRLDSVLHKMSDSFAECQEFIQTQEQDIMRLKLQHALELKEGQSLQATRAKTNEQGKKLHDKTSIHRSPINSPSLLAPVAVFHTNSSSQPELNISSQKCSPTLVMWSHVNELHSVTEGEQSPHTLPSSKEAQDTNRDKSDQDRFRATDIKKQDVNPAFSANNEEMGQSSDQTCNKSCVPVCRKSPVHSLLTSDFPSNNHCSLTFQSSTTEPCIIICT
ncbi:coiled-coil domain-containing protein 158-like [Trichomycterus rosablanca]|uniref:coiled-coil domain-containing protein 158-like n=1 Tax=Trichomycterus rosablanca TaxID=2290929 RepID=UPI002F34F8C3